MKRTIAMTLTALSLLACDRGEQSPMRRDEEAPGAREPRGGTPTPQPTIEEEEGAHALSPGDRTFVRDAASGGMFEVESSKLALQRNALGPMKRFAEMMVSDHTKANDELMALGKKHRWEIPDKMSDKHQRMLTEIKDAPATDLPKTYHRLQLDAHEEALKLFERCAADCDQTELKSFAHKTAGTIRAHRDELKKISPTASLSQPHKHAGM